MRPATPDDIPALVRMGQDFHDYFPQCGDYVAENVAAALRNFIEQDNATLIMTDKAMVAGVIIPALSNLSHLMAVEMAWWAKDGQGIRLLRSFEKWAIAKGAAEVRLTTQTDDPRPNRILERMGYRHLESVFVRPLCH